MSKIMHWSRGLVEQWGSLRIHRPLENGCLLVLSRHGFLLNLKHSTHLKSEKSILITRKGFLHRVLALVETIEDLGNPFLEDTPELLSLDTHHVIDESVAHSIRSIEALGKEKFREYEKAVILNRTKSIFDP